MAQTQKGAVFAGRLHEVEILLAPSSDIGVPYRGGGGLQRMTGLCLTRTLAYSQWEVF